MNLKNIYIETIKNYSSDNSIIENLFSEISLNYNSKSRFYHNFTHIQQMIDFSITIKEKTEDNNSFIIAAFYHDVIYNTFKNNNEEKSAEFFLKHFRKLEIENTIKEKITEMILRTKNHSESKPEDSLDLKLFLDTDILIFAEEEETYFKYVENIKNEYSHVPKIIFNKKRKEILKNFYEKDFIYKTDYFRANFEKKAKENILAEIKTLK